MTEILNTGLGYTSIEPLKPTVLKGTSEDDGSPTRPSYREDCILAIARNYSDITFGSWGIAFVCEPIVEPGEVAPPEGPPADVVILGHLQDMFFDTDLSMSYVVNVETGEAVPVTESGHEYDFALTHPDPTFIVVALP